MEAPVFVEATRGRLVESRHRGALAVVDRSGSTVLALGDVARPVPPRSAVKAMQCVPLITSGAADRFGFGHAEIALCSGSHSGESRHVGLARAVLAAAGLDETALACGAHPPLGEAAAQALLRDGGQAGPLYNNCSGKHAGMLATAVHLGEATAGYEAAHHPVQQRIHGVLEAFAEVSLADDAYFIDGCSVPNWAMPLQYLARAFARLVTGERLAQDHQAATERILQACWAEPELVAGSGRLDTRLLRRFAGEVFLKSGAEGVYCGGIRSRGLGFALKIEDGARRASEAVAAGLIARLVDGADDLAEPHRLQNWDGIEVGQIRLTHELGDALRNL